MPLSLGQQLVAPLRGGRQGPLPVCRKPVTVGQQGEPVIELAVFPGPFTLDAAGAVAGADAETAVLHLVDCSLLTPPRTGPDGRSRYLMLETLRAYGRERLTGAGEEQQAAAGLARFALVTRHSR